jgi:hypothetical protein
MRTTETTTEARQRKLPMLLKSDAAGALAGACEARSRACRGNAVFMVSTDDGKLHITTIADFANAFAQRNRHPVCTGAGGLNDVSIQHQRAGHLPPGERRNAGDRLEY